MSVLEEEGESREEVDQNMLLLLGDGGNAANQYDVEEGKSVRTSPDITGATGVTKMGDTDFVGISCSSGKLHIFDRRTFKIAHSFREHTSTVRSVVSKRNLLFDEAQDNTICVYDVFQKKMLVKWTDIHTGGCSIWVKQMYYIPEKDAISMPSNQQGFIILDVSSGKKIIEVEKIHTNAVYCTPVDLQRNIVYTLSKDRGIGIFDIRTGERAITKDQLNFQSSVGAVRCLCQFPYFGEYTVITSEGDWDKKSGLRVHDLRMEFQTIKSFPEVHGRFITSIKPFSHDTFVTSSWDGTVNKNDVQGIVEKYKVYSSVRNINCVHHFGEFEERLGRLGTSQKDSDMQERVLYLGEVYDDFSVMTSVGLSKLLGFPKIFLCVK